MSNLGLRLTVEQIELGQAALDSGNALKPTQIEDLVSEFRNYLGELADNYNLETDLINLSDSNNSLKCAKLSACLLLWQDYEFLNGGFAPTNANRTGKYFSIDEQNYRIFRYAFGLLYNIPKELDNKYLGKGNQSKSEQGLAEKVW